VYPQPDLIPDAPLSAELQFENSFLQRMGGLDAASNTVAAVAYCQAHPQWRLPVETHKMLGIL
jgi:7-carboxy-7-deazaguanine synthase